jgi:hypothetical protein
MPIIEMDTIFARKADSCRKEDVDGRAKPGHDG